MNEFIFKSYGNSKQSISYCEVDKCKVVVELKHQLDQLKAENEELKEKCNIYTCGACGNKESCNKFYKTLTEIKELLLKTPTDSPMHCVNAKSVILQKISEVVNDYIKL